MKKFACSAFALVCLFLNQAFACTTFCLRGKSEVLFGRNYDWSIGDALIFVNKRGVVKTATIGDSPNSAKWVSKYGSVTFNQYGRENPTGGMNEMGVVVEEMWLDETEYPKDDSRPTVGTQEWIQYLLDNSATTAEAVKNAEGVRIVTDVKVHYLISDKAGNTAALEFVAGKMVVHAGDQLTVPALTNDTYEKSVNYKRTSPVAKATSAGSLDRFVRAAHQTESFAKQPRSEQEAVNYAFEILSNVAQQDYTQWSIVYDQRRGKIYFRTLQSPQIKSIDTKAFDYSCGTTVKMFDINAKDSGDVTAKFTDYTRKANRDLIERSFNGTDVLKTLSAIERFYVASYPEAFKCSAAK
ncbi:MAG TPA: linear amide C-N hydrolase [Pyrinomonadaceae bacterium]|nr:linear amide C-N hydrolase [Pyrinomonadaceae bacterium]